MDVSINGARILATIENVPLFGSVQITQTLTASWLTANHTAAHSPQRRRSRTSTTANSANSAMYCTIRTPVYDVTSSKGRSQSK